MASDEKVLRVLKEERALLLASKEEEETKREPIKSKRKTRFELLTAPLMSAKSGARTEEKREAYLSKQSLHRVAASIQEKALLEKEAKTNVYLQKRKQLKNKSAYEKLQAEPVFGRLNQNLATPRRTEEDEEFIVRLMEGEKSTKKRRVSVQLESKILRTLISPINQVVLHKEQRGWPEIKTPRAKNAFFSKLHQEKSKLQNWNRFGDFIEKIDLETNRQQQQQQQQDRRKSKDFFNIRIENQGSEKRFQVEKTHDLEEEVILNVGMESEKFLFESDPNQGVEKPSPLIGFTNRKSSIAQIMSNYFS